MLRTCVRFRTVYAEYDQFREKYNAQALTKIVEDWGTFVYQAKITNTWIIKTLVRNKKEKQENEKYA